MICEVMRDSLLQDSDNHLTHNGRGLHVSTHRSVLGSLALVTPSRRFPRTDWLCSFDPLGE